MKKLFQKRRNIIILVVILVVLIGGFLLFRPKPESVRYITNNVSKGSITVNVAASGTANVSKIQNAGFRTAGKITKINVKVGDKVRAGQNLAELDNSALQNQLAQSQASLQTAINNYNSSKLLGTKTKYDLDTLQQNINSAQAKVNTDQQNLDNAYLYSQIDGEVVNINNAVGDTVTGSGSNSSTSSTSMSSAVMTVIDRSSMVVNLTVGESDVSKIKVGAITQISFDALGSKKYVGKVQSVDVLGTITSNVVSYSVKLSIDKVDEDVRPGMTANASILIQTKDNILTVPNSAVKTINGQKTVQLLKNNLPVSVPVTTGISNDTETEITEGLSEGDTVITNTISSQTSTPATGPSFFGNRGGAAGGGNNVQIRQF